MSPMGVHAGRLPIGGRPTIPGRRRTVALVPRSPRIAYPPPFTFTTNISEAFVDAPKMYPEYVSGAKTVAVADAMVGRLPFVKNMFSLPAQLDTFVCDWASCWKITKR